jgi:predicted hydrocarbon binding protein
MPGRIRPDSYVINAIFLQALLASEEVLGAGGLNSVLRKGGLEHFVGNYPPDNLERVFPTSEYARLNAAIEDYYGHTGKGILKRIGRASFQYGIREQAGLMGVAGVALKLLPEKQRIKFILNGLVDALKKSNQDVDAWVEDKDGVIAFIDKTCAICWGRDNTHPICHVYIGTVSEAVKWATGFDHEITETHCSAMGDEYCRFEVGAQKLDPGVPKHD